MADRYDTAKEIAASREICRLRHQHGLSFTQNPGGGEFRGRDGFRCQVGVQCNQEDLEALEAALAGFTESAAIHRFRIIEDREMYGAASLQEARIERDAMRVRGWLAEVIVSDSGTVSILTSQPFNLQN